LDADLVPGEGANAHLNSEVNGVWFQAYIDQVLVPTLSPDQTRTTCRKLDRHNPPKTHGRAGQKPHALPMLPCQEPKSDISRIVVTQ
jgi:hypothetical protein